MIRSAPFVALVLLGCAEDFVPDTDVAGCLDRCVAQLSDCMDTARRCFERCPTKPDIDACLDGCRDVEDICTPLALHCASQCVREFEDDLHDR